MKRRILIVFVIVLAFPFSTLISQNIVIDTLSYYDYEENGLFWIDDCFADGYCEPVGVRFIEGNLPVNAITVEKIRFKIAIPGDFHVLLYSGTEFPSTENLAWEDSITVTEGEIDNVSGDSLSIWKEIDFGQSATPLDIHFPIWFQIDTKTLAVAFSEQDDHDQVSQSFYGQMVDDEILWIENYGIEFISELIVSYNTLSITDTPELSNTFKLARVYPNPFNPSTTIQYHIPNTAFVTISIYGIQGNLINTLVSEQLQGGLHEVQWQGIDAYGKAVNTGVYFARVEVGAKSSITKMVYLQ